jgi:AraC-like DNA-binding protein
VEVANEEVDLQMERISFGQYASVNIARVHAREDFRIAPKHESSGAMSPTLSFLVAVSGEARGSLPPIGEFVINRRQGFLTDFSKGQCEFIVKAGASLETFGGTLEVAKIEALFEGAMLNRALGDIRLKRGVLQTFPITQAMRRIIRESLSIPLQGMPRELFLEGSVLQIFALIFDAQLEPERLPPHALPSGPDFEEKIRRVARILTDELSHPPTLLQLSELTGWSARKLSEGFRRKFDQSIVEFLLDKRMERASKVLMSDSSYPLRELAAEVGYNHVSNFNRAFKSYFGTTPKGFARQGRKPGPATD